MAQEQHAGVGVARVEDQVASPVLRRIAAPLAKDAVHLVVLRFVFTGRAVDHRAEVGVHLLLALDEFPLVAGASFFLTPAFESFFLLPLFDEWVG